eukprot:2664436-Rhodomonas_salina.1
MRKYRATPRLTLAVLVCLSSAGPCSSNIPSTAHGPANAYRAPPGPSRGSQPIRLRGGDDWKADPNVLSRRRLVKGRRSEGSGLKSGFFNPESSNPDQNMGAGQAPGQQAAQPPPFQYTSPSFTTQHQQSRNPFDAAAPGRLWGGGM